MLYTIPSTNRLLDEMAFFRGGGEFGNEISYHRKSKASSENKYHPHVNVTANKDHSFPLKVSHETETHSRF